MPDYDLTKPGCVAVSISGRILDESYTRLLMDRTDLSLEQVMLLDKVQKRVPISKEDHRRLKAVSLVEGRYPNLIISGQVARVTGRKAQHIRERGLDKRYYLDLILALVREHGPASRKDVDDMLLAKLPDRLAPEQKRTKVRNLLHELVRKGRIQNQGTRSRPQWILRGKASEDKKMDEVS